MFVVDPSSPSTVDYYFPTLQGAQLGICQGLGKLAFTMSANGIPVLRGITLCPLFFQSPSLRDLGEPSVTQDETAILQQIERYGSTGAADMLHEFAHLASFDCMNKTSSSSRVIMLNKTQLS